MIFEKLMQSFWKKKKGKNYRMELEFFQIYYNIISFFFQFFFIMQYPCTKILKSIYFLILYANFINKYASMHMCILIIQ